jgi:hypothetical protein
MSIAYPQKVSTEQPFGGGSISGTDFLPVNFKPPDARF